MLHVNRLRAVLMARHVRLTSGLILGLFLLTHFTNIGMGLVSPGAMDAARPWLTGLWAGLPGTLALYGALSAHFVLALRALYKRRTLRMSGRELLQLALGALVPFLLMSHVVNTEVLPRVSGLPTSYAQQVRTLWVILPLNGAWQLVAMVVAWLHGCIGIWFWLRTKPWLPRAAPFLLAVALIVPIAASLGFVEAGKEVARTPTPQSGAGPAAVDRAHAYGLALYVAFLGSIGGVLLARGARAWLVRRDRIRVEYPEGRVVTIPAGFSILEASRSARIPHLSVCGGRGRCSTCRVRILRGLSEQPSPDAAERETLARVGADADIRLACQLRPTHDLSVFPVLSAARLRATVPDLSITVRHSTGIEREIAVLFCDLRDFTHRAERLLPYDTVFVLNRYFEIVGEAVQASGGYLDKFIGDGALALFGLDTMTDVACRQALSAAALIARGLGEMNAQLGAELNEPLRIAMGLHCGPAVVGEMGYGRATSLTAVGDGINVASRLEAAAKEFDVEAVVSTAIVANAAVKLPFERRTIAVRGRSAPVRALLVPSALLLGNSSDEVGRLARGGPDPAAIEGASGRD